MAVRESMSFEEMNKLTNIENEYETHFLTGTNDQTTNNCIQNDHGGHSEYSYCGN